MFRLIETFLLTLSLMLEVILLDSIKHLYNNRHKKLRGTTIAVKKYICEWVALQFLQLHEPNLKIIKIIMGNF